jgi:hypothetical protein
MPAPHRLAAGACNNSAWTLEACKQETAKFMKCQEPPGVMVAVRPQTVACGSGDELGSAEVPEQPVQPTRNASLCIMQNDICTTAVHRIEAVSAAKSMMLSIA